MKLLLPVLVLVISCITSVLFADLEGNMSHLNGIAAEAYLQPFASVTGAQAGNGWFHHPPKAKMFGFSFEYGVVQCYAGIQGDKDQSFGKSGKFSFTVEQANSMIPDEYTGADRDALVNAIIGQEFDVNISGPTLNGYEYSSGGWFSSSHPNVKVFFPGALIQANNDGVLLNLSIPYTVVDLEVAGMQQESFIFGDAFTVPLRMQQVTIGTIAGTQCILRGGVRTDSNVGYIESKGFGIQHNPAVWLHDKSPFDLSLILGYQTVDIGEITKTSSMTQGAALSFTHGGEDRNVTVYMMLAHTQSKMKVKYIYPIGLSPNGEYLTKNVAFDLEGKNTTNFTLGADFRLYFLEFKFEGNFSSYNGNCVGISVFHTF